MPSTHPKQGSFRPVHAAHSIEQAALVVNFDRPLDYSRLAAVNEITNQFREELPGGGPIQGGFSFMIGGPAVMQVPFNPQQPAPVTGILLHRNAPDGSIERELRVEQSSMSFRTNVYSRWSAVWELAHKYFSSVMGTYLDSGANLVNVSLNFVDKFVWDGEMKNCNPSLLIKHDSKYVASHVFSRDDLWHSHTGAFDRSDNQTKRLTNVNIDCLDEVVGFTPRRSVVITTVLTDMFNQPSYDMTSLSQGNGMDFVTSHLEALHNYDKEILREILVAPIAQQIALLD
jgi:uncharacterized protein (TIGR04255 family)